MRLKLIVCEIFCREACALIADSPHRCDVEFLPKGLHDLGAEKMVPRLQEQIDRVPEGAYEAIGLGYGLCNNGIVGLAARHTPVVIPRAHDCIALFMGSRQRYLEYFNAHPGTYYRTSGWYEREDAAGAGDVTVPQKLGLFLQYEELVRKYGEDNAKYIMETLGNPTVNYDRVTFIAMGLPCDERFRQRAVEEAQERGWTYDELPGSTAVLRKLIDGEWNDDFLVLKPGDRVKASHDDQIIEAEGPSTGAATA
jgi:hypothetical protein